MEAWGIRKAVNDAKALQKKVDDTADIMVDLLVGRLKHVSSWKLKQLKKRIA